jgi:hypothetical protein
VVPVVILSLALVFEMGWNAWNYFQLWAPQNRYSDYNSTLSSLIGEYLSEQPPDTQAYVAATSGYWTAGSNAVEFLRRSTTVEDVKEPFADVISGLKLGTHTVFIFPEGRESDLAVVQDALPGGQVVQKYLNGLLCFTAYLL